MSIASPMDNGEIEDFWLVSQECSLEFVRALKDFLQKGWVLYGFPFTKGPNYCQAIIKYKKGTTAREKAKAPSRAVKVKYKSKGKL